MSYKLLKPQLRLLRRPFLAVGDNDDEGRQFANRYGGFTSPVDLDEMKMSTNFLDAAKHLAARTYTSYNPKKQNVDPDKVWDKLSCDTQKWALAVVEELHDRLK